MTPTYLELAALEAILECGTEQAAADKLDITYHALHKRIVTLKVRLDVSTTAQAFSECVRRGLLNPREIPARRS